MKNIAFAMVVFATAGLASCGGSEPAPEVTEQAEPAVQLESLEAKISYLVGFNNIAQLKAQGVEIDIDAFTAGVSAASDGAESAISSEDGQAAFTEFQQMLQDKAKVEFEKAAAENLARSEAFMTENGTNEGVMTTESGLQYKVLEAGDGEKPTTTSTVQVHYEGRLINGEIFDSSIARGAPVEFALTQVIPGWTEGLQLMPQGAKYEFYIPSDLAYGPGGSRSLGPNQALIFVVELLDANYTAE